MKNKFFTIASVLSICANMYTKCGSIEVTCAKLFSKMSRRDVVPWDATIAIYAYNGNDSESLELFHHIWVNMVTYYVTIEYVVGRCSFRINICINGMECMGMMRIPFSLFLKWSRKVWSQIISIVCLSCLHVVMQS